MSFIKWHPKTGEHKVFNDDETAPADWLDYHPDDTDKSGGAAVGEKPLTKKEVTEALQTGGIAFDPKATVADLTQLLHDTLVKVISDRGEAVAEGESTRALLARVMG